MDPFDNFKKAGNPSKKRHKNTDGFVRNNNPQNHQAGFQFERRSEDDSASRIDNFDRADGYHPASQPTVGLPAQPKSDMTMLSNQPRSRSQLPHHQPNHKKKKWWLPHKPKSWKKFFKRTAIVVAVLVLLLGGFLGYKLYRTKKNVLAGGGNAPAVCDGDVPVDKLNTEGDGRVNVLLLGIGGPGHDAPNLTDTIIVASIDTVTDKADLISVPRDLWVKIPNVGYEKINASFEYGIGTDPSSNLNKTRIQSGLKQADQVIGGALGLKIHYNVLLDFKAFKDAVNALGGITVNVPEQLYDPSVAWENNWNSVIAEKGVQKFNGAKALLYARSRETSSDFARGERQRLLLVAIKDKAFSLGTFSNPLKITKLLDSLGNNVYTDFDLDSIKCLYKQGSEIQSSNIKSVDFATPPNDLVTTGNIGGKSVVYPKAGLYDFSAIQSFVRRTTVDGFLAKENSKVLVLNGTGTSGLGERYVNLLKSYGYNVSKPGDAPSKNYEKTIIVEMKKKDKDNKYTRNYLEKRFKVSTQSKIPESTINPGDADFVIILGADRLN